MELKYKDYIIDKVTYRGDIYDWYMRANYSFVHDDYDGAPDAGDCRCGYGDSIEDVKKQIDEQTEEEG